MLHPEIKWTSNEQAKVAPYLVGLFNWPYALGVNCHLDHSCVNFKDFPVDVPGH